MCGRRRPTSCVEAVLPPDDRAEDTQPEEDAKAADACEAKPIRDVAGTLRAPWRWEDLIVEAAVIGGLDRWQRRLEGLEHEYDRRVREASSDDPDASRARALRPRPRAAAARCGRSPSRCSPRWRTWPPAQIVGRLAEGARAAGAARDCASRRACCACCSELAPLAGDRPGAPARSARRADAAAVDPDARTAAPPSRPRVRRHAAAPRAAARSASCSCPGSPNGCFRNASAKTRCCPTIGAKATDPALATQPRARRRRTTAADAGGRRRGGAFVRVVSAHRAERVAPARAVVLRARHPPRHRGPHSARAEHRRARVPGRRRPRWRGRRRSIPRPRSTTSSTTSRRWAALLAASSGERERPRALSLRAQPRAAAIADRALAAVASAAVGTGRRPRARRPT